MIQDDFTINYGTKRVSHTSGTTVYTANQLYSWLQDEFDELAQMDDPVPMKANTPSEYEWINGWAFNADSDYQFIKGGSIKDNTNDAIWANIYTLGTIEAGTEFYVEQDDAVITSFWGTGHIDILVKVSDGGVLIDSGFIEVYARELSNAYDLFKIDLSSGGRNPIPLATSVDLNNQTLEATIATYNDITITFGSISRDMNNGNGSVNYDAEIDCAGRPLSQVYEYLKYITRRGSTFLINGTEGQIYESANPSYTPVKSAPFGTFAGGTFFGARGIWITNFAANQSYQLVDSANGVQIPPTTVYINISALVVGDRLAVFKLDGVGGSIEKDTYAVSSRTTSTIVMSTSIASDTPQSGYLSVDGNETSFTYTSWNGSTFSGVSPDPIANGVVAADDVYIPLINKVATATSENNSFIYSADVPVLIRVRKKGILPFEIEGLITISGLSQAVIRTIDSIVS